ncbi:MAG: hypothetical protein AB7M05_15970 [Alphaproteobacteria bacterium]
MGDDKKLSRASQPWTKADHPDPSVHGWKKGQSGCLGGQHGTHAMHRALEGRSGKREIRRLFRRKSIAVVHALARIIADENAPASVRVAASQLFLDRGWGKIETDAAAKGGKKKAARRNVVVISNVPRSPFKKSGGV